MFVSNYVSMNLCYSIAVNSLMYVMVCTYDCKMYVFSLLAESFPYFLFCVGSAWVTWPAYRYTLTALTYALQKSIIL